MQLLWKTLIYGMTGYLLFCLALFFLQQKLLYFPDQTKLSPENAARLQLHHWPSPNDFRGYVSSREIVNPRGTVIVFHGNAGAAYHRNFYAAALSQLNMRVLLAEYPGYGGREGKPGQNVFTKDAVETIRQVHQQFGNPIFLWGESLGSAVVSSAAGETDIPVQGLALLLPWDRLVELAKKQYWFVPVQLLLRDKYDNIKNLKGYEGKIAVLVAEDDEIVPASHGKALYEVISSPKKIWVFDNAGHNNFPIAPEKKWWKEVVAFLAQPEASKK